MRLLLLFCFTFITYNLNCQITFTALKNASANNERSAFIGGLIDNEFTYIDSRNEEGSNRNFDVFAYDYERATANAKIWVYIYEGDYPKIIIRSAEHDINSYLMNKIKQYCDFIGTERSYGEIYDGDIITYNIYHNHYYHKSGVSFRVYSKEGIDNIVSMKSLLDYSGLKELLN